MCKRILVYRNPKNESLQAKTCENDEQKWPKLDLASRTAERPPPKKKTAKIDDFRSVLREKIDFRLKLYKSVFFNVVLGKK